MRDRRFPALAAALLVVSILPALVLGRETEPRGPAARLYLAGQLLVAKPTMGDPRFVETVIYMVSHDASGALGLVVNKVVGQGPLASFLKGFGIEAADAEGTIRIHYGGPVEPGRGFVLHTGDYKTAHTTVVTSQVSMTVELDVLKAMATGSGPRRSLFILGYAGWGPGQLEGELARGDWLTAPADEAIVFDDDFASKWARARKKAGLSL